MATSKSTAKATDSKDDEAPVGADVKTNEHLAGKPVEAGNIPEALKAGSTFASRAKANAAKKSK